MSSLSFRPLLLALIVCLAFSAGCFGQGQSFPTTAGGPCSVSGSQTAGTVLTATDSLNCSWQTPSGGGTAVAPRVFNLISASSVSYPAATHGQGLTPSVSLYSVGATTYTITGCTNAAPIVCTTSSTAGLSQGSVIYVTGVTGNTAANMIWQLGTVTSTTFALTGSTGNGAYVSGGTAQLAQQQFASNIYTDPAGDVFLAFNPAFTGMVVIGSGGGSVSGSGNPAGSQYSVQLNSGVGSNFGAGNLLFNTSTNVLSLSQGSFSPSSHVNLAEILDTASLTPVGPFNAGVLINTGSCPDSMQQVAFPRRNGFASVICPGIGVSGGGAVAISGVAGSQSTGGIGGYFSCPMGADGVLCFGTNPVWTNCLAVATTGGIPPAPSTCFSSTLGVSAEHDMFNHITHDGSLMTNLINTWITCNSCEVQSSSSMEGVAVVRFNGLGVLGQVGFKQSFVCVDGSASGDCLYAGSVAPTNSGASITTTTAGKTFTIVSGDNVSLDGPLDYMYVAGSSCTAGGANICKIATITGTTGSSAPPATAGTFTEDPGNQSGVAWSMVGASQTLTFHALTAAGGAPATAQMYVNLGGNFVEVAPNTQSFQFYTGGQFMTSMSYTSPNTFLSLGQDNVATNGGLLQLANPGANAHSLLASAATSNNTVLLPATTPTSGNLLKCVGASPNCTLTDAGFFASNVAQINITNTFSALQTVTLAPAANTASDGLELYDNTAASSGNQQYSPVIHWKGQGWQTTTPASQTIDWLAYAIPVQGAANPSSTLVFQSQVNGGGYANEMTLSSAGVFTATARVVSGGLIQLASTSGIDFGTAGSGRDIITSAANGSLSVTDTSGAANGFTGTVSGDEVMCYSTSTFILHIAAATCGTSLAQYKTNIAELDHGLDYVMQYRPVEFDWRADSGYKPKAILGMHDIGMIANEVAAVDPMLGSYRDDGTLYNFRDRAVLATVIKAVQELKGENDALRGRIAVLETR